MSRWRFGPGLLAMAAFIGPGTVTACTLAGANFGFDLVWALAFATVATIVLQDMTARLGAGGRLGLGEALMKKMSGPVRKVGVGLLVFLALFLGNSAYEGGNLTGAALGLEAVFGPVGPQRWVWLVGLAALAAGTILIGRYAVLERLLIGLVMLMTGAFLVAALVIRPDLRDIAEGLVPRLPSGAGLTAMALVGTTIVPYNLFLHAAAVKQKWPDGQGVMAARRDAAISIGLGGLVSIMILSTAAAALFGRAIEIRSAAEMALAIEPVFGASARYLLGLGLFAAGLTSAITAPVATAYAMTEVIGGTRGQDPRVFRLIALSVVLIGVLVGLTGVRPILLILVAQLANGLLLPITALFLLYVMNQSALLGSYRNSLAANVAGGGVICLTLVLGARSLLGAAGLI